MTALPPGHSWCLALTHHAHAPEEFRVDGFIARGQRGVVASASEVGSSGRRHAIKKILRDTLCTLAMRRQVQAEREALCSVHHPCICELHATYKNSRAIYLVMELCDGPQLYSALQHSGGLQEEQLRLCAACVVGALGALHEHGWLYRDVKAENFVFVSSGALKLVDCGLATLVPLVDERCFTR